MSRTLYAISPAMLRSEQAQETAARLCELAEGCDDFTKLQAVGVPAAAVQLLKMKADLSRQIGELESKERELWQLLVKVIQST